MNGIYATTLHRISNRKIRLLFVHQKKKVMKTTMSSKRNWIIALLIVSNFIMAFKLQNNNQETDLTVSTAVSIPKDSIAVSVDTITASFIPKNDDNEPEKSITLSRYDNFIKKYADEIGWDWRLVASIIYKESKFDASAHSGGGMVGLMQLVPSTGYKFGLPHGKEYNPEENIKAGVAYIKALDKLWSKVPEKEERLKFIIASYNSGEGHVKDAARLATKYGKSASKWDDNVAFYLSCKNQSQYYKDPVVQCGYFNGSRTVNYVKAILIKFDEYKSL